MKTFLIATLVLLLLLFGLNCKKSSGSDNGGNTTSVPKPTAVGTPTGAVTSKLIPKTGGTVSSADEQLEIDFPANALSATKPLPFSPSPIIVRTAMGWRIVLGPMAQHSISR